MGCIVDSQWDFHSLQLSSKLFLWHKEMREYEPRNIPKLKISRRHGESGHGGRMQGKDFEESLMRWLLIASLLMNGLHVLVGELGSLISEVRRLQEFLPSRAISAPECRAPGRTSAREKHAGCTM